MTFKNLLFNNFALSRTEVIIQFSKKLLINCLLIAQLIPAAVYNNS